MGGTSNPTLLGLVDQNATEHADLPAVVDGEQRLTWSQYRRRARAIALALIDLGVQPGQVVGLHMVNRAEHVLSDVAALVAGATPTSYYNTLSADQLAYVARDSAARVAIVDADKLPLWLAIRDELPELTHLVVLDGVDARSVEPTRGVDARSVEPTRGVDARSVEPTHGIDARSVEQTREENPPTGVHRFAELVDAAERALDERSSEVDAVTASVRPDSPLTIVYTSGTTGPPKGTVITHAGVCHVMDGLAARIEQSGRPVPDAGAAALSYLPLAHLAERMFTHYLGMRYACTVTYLRDHRRLAAMLPVVRPHVFLGVPRIWEKMYSTIRERAATEANPTRRALGEIALLVAKAYGQAAVERRSPDPLSRILHPIMDQLVYRRVRAALGLDRVIMAASGAAPLSTEILAFFQGLGIVILEAYGMTETSAVLTVTPPDAPRPGTVGTALPGVELRIADDGEILARGPNITPGYLNRPDATAETIDADGWLHTGDIGELDNDGYLRITGRKKELIVNAAGKNISPANVELAVSSESDLIGPVYVHGDNRPYLVALLTLDALGWRDWCVARGIEVASPAEAAAHPEVRKEAARAVAAGNERLARVEQIKRWELLDHLWDGESGELTPTMKLKRSVVAERYREHIDRFYAEQGR
jgi:long-chain acyl-CoA synthetase